MYIPMKPKNSPTENRVQGTFLNTFMSINGRRWAGKTFARITRTGTIKVANIMKAMTRAAHANPMRG